MKRKLDNIQYRLDILEIEISIVEFIVDYEYTTNYWLQIILN